MASQIESKPSAGKFVLNILLSGACSIFIACLLPAIVASLLGYRFDLQIYLEVFIRIHHNIAAWFERGWPDILMPLSIMVSYFIGGIILYAFQKRRIRSGSFRVKRIVYHSISFAIVYLFVAMLLGVLAVSSRPYSINMTRFISDQGLLQTITLLVLSSLLCGLGILTMDHFRGKNGSE